LGDLYSVYVCVCYIQGAYIWNVASVCTSDGLIHGGLYSGGGAYSRRFTVLPM
jgi:hypothetical protein